MGNVTAALNGEQLPDCFRLAVIIPPRLRPSDPVNLNMNRRQFAKTSALAAGSLLLPRFSIARPGASANSRLNLAHIGAGNIAEMAYGETADENVVALCDVDSAMIAEAKAKFPHLAAARTFTDYREMFDKLGREIDAVCVSTPDHSHYLATRWALEHDKHVCTQKPLTYTVGQARTLRAVAAAKSHLITNMANQGHTSLGIRQNREWIEQGLIGEVRAVHAWERGPEWGNPWFDKPASFPPPEEPVPATLDWDLWLGPMPVRPYSSFYHPKKWRGFWETGTGMLGDWFCHTCDGAVWGLDLYEPVAVELITKGGDNGPQVIPNRSVVKWTFPARSGMPACELYWHDGGMRPSVPDNWTFGPVPDRGSFFLGTKNTLFLDERSNNPRLVNREEMIAYKQSGYLPEKYPRVKSGGPFAEWVRAIKGEGARPGSSFDYSSRLTEVALLGVLAQRFGGKLVWDATQGRIINRPELNAYLDVTPRKGWEI